MNLHSVCIAVWPCSIDANNLLLLFKWYVVGLPCLSSSVSNDQIRIHFSSFIHLVGIGEARSIFKQVSERASHLLWNQYENCSFKAIPSGLLVFFSVFFFFCIFNCDVYLLVVFVYVCDCLWKRKIVSESETSIKLTRSVAMPEYGNGLAFDNNVKSTKRKTKKTIWFYFYHGNRSAHLFLANPIQSNKSGDCILIRATSSSCSFRKWQLKWCLNNAEWSACTSQRERTFQLSRPPVLLWLHNSWNDVACLPLNSITPHHTKYSMDTWIVFVLLQDDEGFFSIFFIFFRSTFYSLASNDCAKCSIAKARPLAQIRCTFCMWV